jgi:hypothetical protein
MSGVRLGGAESDFVDSERRALRDAAENIVNAEMVKEIVYFRARDEATQEALSIASLRRRRERLEARLAAERIIAGGRGDVNTGEPAQSICGSASG